MTKTQSHNDTIPHQQLFASVVLAALDDAISDEQSHGVGADGIASWAKSKDGQTVLRCAGIEPSNRCVEGLKRFVQQGIKTSAALSRGPLQMSLT
jgi:hypothetical protein